LKVDEIDKQKIEMQQQQGATIERQIAEIRAQTLNITEKETSNMAVAGHYLPAIQTLLETWNLRSSGTSSQEILTGLLPNALAALVTIATHSNANQLESIEERKERKVSELNDLMQCKHLTND